MNRSVRDPTIDLMTDSGSDSSLETSGSEFPTVKKRKTSQPANKTTPAKFGGKQKRYKQKYRIVWEREFPWLRQSEVDEFHFFCVLCEKNYLGGITEITKHESSYKHSSAALKSQGAFTPQAFGKPISRSRPKYPIFFGTVSEERKDTPNTRSQTLTNQKAKLCFESKLMKIEKEEESSTAVKNIPNKKVTGGVIVHPQAVPSTLVSSQSPTGEVLNQITIQAADELISEEGIDEAPHSSPPSPPSAQMPSDGAAQDPGQTSASSAQELFDSMVDQQADQAINEREGGNSMETNNDDPSIKSNNDDAEFNINAHGLTPEEIVRQIRASQGKSSRTYKQRYRTAWEAEFSWVEKSKVDEFHFRCKACLRDYYGGLSEIMNHGATAKHCVSEYKRLAMLNDVGRKPAEGLHGEIIKGSPTELAEINYTDGDGDSFTYETCVIDKPRSPTKYEKLAYERSNNEKPKPSPSLQERPIDAVRHSKELLESELKLVRRRAEIVEVEMRTALLNEHTAMLRKKVAAAELKLKEAELGKLGLVFKKKSGRK